MTAFFARFFSANNRNGILFTMFAAAILSYCLSIGYVLLWNPEIRFWKYAAEYKLEEVASLRAEQNGAITFCYGGSSTAFGIDSGYASDQLAYPMINLGLHAGMGAEALSGFGLSQLQPGDTLLVMLEPDLIVAEDMRTPLGEQFGYAMGDSSILSWRSGEGEPRQFMTTLPSLRPGALNIFSMVGKIILGRPIYRYHRNDLRPGGLVITDVRGEIVGKNGVVKGLRDESRILLRSLVFAAEERGARAFYCPPWALFNPEVVERVQSHRIRFLKQVEQEIPVIWEPGLGILTNREDFSDSPQHLTGRGARFRTESLVRVLRKSTGR